MNKICTKCNTIQSLENFTKDAKFKDGKSCVCKLCIKQYKQSNKVKFKLARQLAVKNRTVEQKIAINQSRREYYQKNKRSILVVNKRYKSNRLKTDPKFRLNSNISTYIRISLKGNKKRKHWETLVGYNLEALKRHIESQFEPWMSWNNYGKWHIDHIKPVCAFNYVSSNEPEFKECWALSNLRPLQAELNLKKAQEDKLHPKYGSSINSRKIIA